MFSRSTLLIVAVLMIATACKKSDSSLSSSTAPNATPTEASASPPATPSAETTAGGQAKTDACALLTSADIQAVQAEAVKETKLSGSTEGGFTVSQCFFTLPTFINSISLQVTQRGDGARARDPREFWVDTFHRDEKSEKEREKEKGRKQEEEEETAAPLKVSGVGDEAFWMGSRVGGALYVLKGNDYIRVSVGGPGDQTDKIRKSKLLAQKVISRLRT